MAKVVPPAQMVILMKPLFTVGQWFGLFPLVVDVENPDRALYKNKATFNYVRSVVIFCFATAYVMFHIGSIVISIWNNFYVVEIMGQSLWLQGSVISYIVSIQLLLRPEPFIDLFTKDWRAVETDCGKVFSAQYKLYFS